MNCSTRTGYSHYTANVANTGESVRVNSTRLQGQNKRLHNLSDQANHFESRVKCGISPRLPPFMNKGWNPCLFSHTIDGMSCINFIHLKKP